MSLVYTVGDGPDPSLKVRASTLFLKTKHKLAVVKRRVLSLHFRHSSNFFDLPLNVRHQIYRYSVPPSFGIGKVSHDPKKCPNVFVLSKKIHEEALRCIWGERVITLDLTKARNDNQLLHQLKPNMIVSNLRRIRFLVLSIPYPDMFSNDVLVAPEKVFCLIIPRLTKLRFVCPGGKWHTNIGMQKWRRNITEWLKGIVKYTSKKTVVEVDCLGNQNLLVAFEKGLWWGFREVHIPMLQNTSYGMLEGLE